MIDHAERSGQQECCGLLLDFDGRATAVAATNVAPDPTRHFEIDPADLIAAEKRARSGGPAVLGCYHSHPNGRAEPSATDAALAAPDGRIWGIVAGGEVRWYRSIADGPIHGRFIPVSAVIIG